ncbi:hypothetical protein AB7008_09205 [Bradyrhizobium sp. 521_C7_N1_3]|uniref:hypothetical protein n=1 Tax=Bradyrhizobium sp. 521_C7_N1_3 TaxID=3240368 RepID=UPI003F8AAABC
MIEALDVRYIVPGHGNVCGTAEVKHFRQQMEDHVGQVERRVDAGQSKEFVMTEVKYEDNIHTAVSGWTSFPEHMIKSCMMRGISRFYDDVLNRRSDPHPTDPTMGLTLTLARTSGMPPRNTTEPAVEGRRDSIARSFSCDIR